MTERWVAGFVDFSLQLFDEAPTPFHETPPQVAQPRSD